MPNQSNSLLNSFYTQLDQLPLTEFIKSAKHTKNLNEREFYIMLLNFELEKRQRRILPKKGGNFFDL